MTFVVLGMLLWYENVIWFFGNFMVSRELEGLSEAKERKIWTFIVKVMVIKGILFIQG
jgi:hypothetical protein